MLVQLMLETPILNLLDNRPSATTTAATGMAQADADIRLG